jgi:hypothetical protein
MTFEITGETLAALDELKCSFGVTTRSAVLRRSLALARVAAEIMREDHTVTMFGDGPKLQLVLNS